MVGVGAGHGDEDRDRAGDPGPGRREAYGLSDDEGTRGGGFALRVRSLPPVSFLPPVYAHYTHVPVYGHTLVPSAPIDPPSPPPALPLLRAHSPDARTPTPLAAPHPLQCPFALQVPFPISLRHLSLLSPSACLRASVAGHCLKRNASAAGVSDSQPRAGKPGGARVHSAADGTQPRPTPTAWGPGRCPGKAAGPAGMAAGAAVMTASAPSPLLSVRSLREQAGTIPAGPAGGRPRRPRRGRCS